VPRDRNHCPVCLCSDTQELWSLSYGHPFFNLICSRVALTGGEVYCLRSCQRCGLVFQQTVLTETEDRLLNQDYWQGKLPDRAASLRTLAHHAEEALLIRLLFPDTTPTVLDFGVGCGNWAGVVRGFQCEVWGTDSDPLCEQICQSRAIRWCRPNELPDHTFDFINADSVFEHLPEPLETLQRLIRSLVPGGLIKINVPGKKDLPAWLSRVVHSTDTDSLKGLTFGIEPLVHLNLFNRKSLQTLGRKSGLLPYRVPLPVSYASMILFDSLRQWNRNLYQPFKRWRSRGTWQFFRKPYSG